MADDITELVRLLREKPDITSHCAASCIEGFQRKAAKVSPDPVVVRLEAEVEELKRQLADAQCQLVASHPEAWANITKRLTDERDEARDDVTRLNARLLQIHTAAGEAVANPPSPIDAYRILKDDNARLRGLLREACEYAKADESDWKAWYPRFIPEDWCDRAQAALEGKP